MKKIVLSILFTISSLVSFSQSVASKINQLVEASKFDSAQILYNQNPTDFLLSEIHIVQSNIYHKMADAIIKGKYIDNYTNLSAKDALDKAIRIYKNGSNYANGKETSAALYLFGKSYLTLYDTLVKRQEYFQALDVLKSAGYVYTWVVDKYKYDIEKDKNYPPYEAEVTRLESELKMALNSINTFKNTKEGAYIEQIAKARKEKNTTEWQNLILKARAEQPSNYTFIQEEFEFLTVTKAGNASKKRLLKKANADCPDSAAIVVEWAKVLYEEAVQENEFEYHPELFTDINTLLYKQMLKNPNNNLLKTMALDVHLQLLDLILKENKPELQSEIKSNATKALKLSNELVNVKDILPEKLKSIQDNKQILENILKQ